jgi:hypothetical protein
VVSAIERQAAILASGASDSERLLALKYIVHLVGDIHQPVHAGYASDKGGNGYQLQAFGRGSNLHSLWDSGLIRNWPSGLSALQAAVMAESGSAGGRAKDWAEASCKIVGTGGFYPATHTLNEEYPGRWSAALLKQLSAGSRRLAELLNRSLGSR